MLCIRLVPRDYAAAEPRKGRVSKGQSTAEASVAGSLAGMRLSVRQRWCSLLSEIGCPHQPHLRSTTLLPWVSSTQPSTFRRLLSYIAAPSQTDVFPTSSATRSPVFAPPLSPSPPDSPDQYHRALALAARAAHLGHPHAVIAIIDSLRQQISLTSLSHPALHNHLLRAYLLCPTLSHERRYERMREVWRDMRAEKIRCNQRTYRLLLNGCVRKHRHLLNDPAATAAPTLTASPASHSNPSTPSILPAPSPSCLQECLELVAGVALSTSVCNLLIKAALLSVDYSYPFSLFQHCFPPLLPNSSTLSLLVDTALMAPAGTHGGVNSTMEWYVKVRDTSRAGGRAAVAGTPAMYAKLMRRCLQAAAGTREVQHVPVLFSHMEEAGVRAEAEHVRCLLLALSRLQLNGAGWGVWHKMESERRVQRTDETDALMLRVMSEEKDHKRAMEVILSIEHRWAAIRSDPSTASAPPSTVSSSVISNYRSAISNFSRNGHSTTLLVLLSHVFSSRYASAVLRDEMLESVVRRWREAGRSVDELRAKVRQWVAAVDMSERELDGWQALAAILVQRRHDTSTGTTALFRAKDGTLPALNGSVNGSMEHDDDGCVPVDVDDTGVEELIETDDDVHSFASAATVTAPSITSGTEFVHGSKQAEQRHDVHKPAHAVYVSEPSVDEQFGDRAIAGMAATAFQR